MEYSKLNKFGVYTHESCSQRLIHASDRVFAKFHIAHTPEGYIPSIGYQLRNQGRGSLPSHREQAWPSYSDALLHCIDMLIEDLRGIVVKYRKYLGCDSGLHRTFVDDAETLSKSLIIERAKITQISLF